MGMGSLVILIVGLCSKNLTLKSTWEGIRLIALGVFSTGRNAAGELTFGFNPASMGNMLFRATPIILTGLSVGIAFKTGLFNIGAADNIWRNLRDPFIALSIPAKSCPPGDMAPCFSRRYGWGALWGAIPGMLKAF